MDPRTPPTPTPPGKDHSPSPLAPARADWIDTAIQWASGTAAVAMFAYGVALSYAVLHAVAAAADLPGWAARLWPLGFEAFMASAALNALAEQRHRRHLGGWQQRVPWYPWTLTGLTAGGSILLNWFHPAIPLDPPPGWLVSLVYGLPPLIAVFAWHLFLQRVAHRRHPAPTLAGTVPVVGAWPAGPDPQQDRDGEAGVAAVGVPVPPPPVRDGRPSRPPARTPAGPARAGPAAPRPIVGTADALDAGLLVQAWAAAVEHETSHGRPISRDALRQALRVSNQTAGALLHQLRADQAEPRPQPQDQDRDGGMAVGTSEPEPAGLGAPTDGGPVAGNGAGGPPAGVAALVPVPGRDGQEGTGDA